MTTPLDKLRRQATRYAESGPGFQLGSDDRTVYPGLRAEYMFGDTAIVRLSESRLWVEAVGPDTRSSEQLDADGKPLKELLADLAGRTVTFQVWKDADEWPENHDV